MPSASGAASPESSASRFFGGVPTNAPRAARRARRAPAGRFALGTLRFLFTARRGDPGRPDPRLRGARPRAEAGLRPDRDLGDLLPRRARRDPEGRQRRAAGLPRRRAHRALARRSEAAGGLGDTARRRDRARSSCAARSRCSATGSDPEATAETIRDGWLRTGDLATRGRRRLRDAHRARARHVHLGRRERLPRAGRGGLPRASRGPRDRGGRRARRALGRGRARLRRAGRRRVARPRRRSRTSAASGSRASRCRATSSRSTRCPAPSPARCRSSGWTDELARPAERRSDRSRRPPGGSRSPRRERLRAARP